MVFVVQLGGHRVDDRLDHREFLRGGRLHHQKGAYSGKNFLSSSRTFNPSEMMRPAVEKTLPKRQDEVDHFHR